MNRSHREDKSGRDVGLIGEREEKVSGYDTKAWHPVDKMLRGDHPTTNIGTVTCAGSSMSGNGVMKEGCGLMKEQKRMVEGNSHHKKEMDTPKMMKKGGKACFAAGGVGKLRKGQY